MKKQELTGSLHTKQISVLLAEDNGPYRRSLKSLIELEGNMEIVGEARNGLEAVRMTETLRPEVVIMDVAMPLMNGLQATQRIMETSPGTKVLILSAHPDSEYIKEAAICGAYGYLIKQSSTHLLARAVRKVFEGNSFFCAPMARQLRDECRKLFGKSELLRKRTARVAAGEYQPLSS